ncbi:MAG: methylenetetrahydrofolate reductase [NAD(P)H] [Ruminococcus sp.]|nr:methylenetetrahydrofolate reductase [NAD(P)H] [Ruminococcus sp.]
MKITNLFRDRMVFSFEIFPPKKTSPGETIYSTLEALQDLHPDFISVTLGAGGSGNGANAIAIARRLKEKYDVLPMAHVPCIHRTKEEIDNILNELQDAGIENVLALHGDIVPDTPVPEDFSHASELIAYIQEKGDFDIGAACYPECHPSAPNLDVDIQHLKEKVDAGATHLITQLFFDNEMFRDFRYRAQRAGVNVPIEAGIMPVTNRKQIERMVTMCGASLPRKFTKLVQRFEDQPEALRDAGIAYAVEQIVDLITDGVDGIHVYTMNNPYVARKITEAVSGILRAAPIC